MDGKEAQVPLCAAPLATQRPNALSPPSGESGGRQTAIVGHPLSQSGQPLLGNGLPLSSDGSQSAAGSPLHLTSSPFSRRMLLLRPPFFDMFILCSVIVSPLDGAVLRHIVFVFVLLPHCSSLRPL